ncbi:MAG: alpha/beta hydrolase [Negativicutes bacterium]|nr:alpha/beta hydrolase [Negativicutes bacterium]
MNAVIEGLKINYKMSGRGRPVLVLHGWGGRIESMEPIHRHLEKSFTVYSVDLPGFGQSDEPPEAWDSVRYKEIVEKLIDELGIAEPILIGHSFGGKVSIRVAAERKIRKLILVDSAGIKPTRTVDYYLRVYLYKTVKAVLQLPVIRTLAADTVENFKKRMGSDDYRNASGVMRQTLVKAVNEDVRELLPRIQVPTLLIWGENDTATPVEDGKIMEKLIPDAGLVVLKNAGHFAYLDKMNDFLIIISEFLKKDMEDRRD